MFTKRLTARRNDVLRRKKESLEEDPFLRIYLEYQVIEIFE